ncbi:unnamed protein product [Symbiodinium necroappetens]|uniref:Uncharacterized protein n=1 Tax=Symbiodinium necroappetens TaxID=1628268 RepID=A0A813AQ51_9DINO|nr:unnamed protein product [Symbiodinium necroappetens]
MRELRDYRPFLLVANPFLGISFADFLGARRSIPQGTSITVAFNTSDSLQLIPGQKPDYQLDFDFDTASGYSLLLYDAVSGEFTDTWIWTFQGFASRRPGPAPLPALAVYFGSVDGVEQYFVSSNLASVPWGTYCVTPATPACPPAPSGELPKIFKNTGKIVPGLVFSLMVLGPDSAALELTALRDLRNPNQNFTLSVLNSSLFVTALANLPALDMSAGERIWIIFTENPDPFGLFPRPPFPLALGAPFGFQNQKGEILTLVSADEVEDKLWDRWGIPRSQRREGEEWVFGEGYAARKPGLASNSWEGLTQWSITQNVYDPARVPWGTYCVG